MERIVNICFRTLFPDVEEMITQLDQRKRVWFEYTPLVFYNEYYEEKITGTTWITLDECFTIFGQDTSFAVLKNFFSDDFNKEGLVVAHKAFKNLKNLCRPLAEKVIADICCQIILQTLRNNDEDDVIFFIDRMFSDKILGRLGYLYLNMKNVTICFLSWRPADLITIVMSKQTGKLHFDINRLLSASTPNDLFGPYPSSPEDALKQTYFLKPQNADQTILPIRFDIFSQGLSEGELVDKSERIKGILESSRYSIIHYKENMDYPVMLPKGFSLLNMLDEKEIRNLAKMKYK